MHPTRLIMVLAWGLQLSELVCPLLFPEPMRSYEEEPNFIRKYKTALCKHWEIGPCPFGPACTFAHGLEELREKPKVRSNKRSKGKKSASCGEASKSGLSSKRRLPVFEAIEAKGTA